MSDEEKLKMCTGKPAFASKVQAERNGQRSYLCQVCHYYHRTGQISQIQNPVLRSDTKL